MISSQTEILSLLEQLVKIESIATNSSALSDIISLAENYFSKSSLIVRKFTHNNISSLLVTPKNWSGKGLLLNAHLDVVPGENDQFHLKIVDNKVYGRGVYDMKAATAVFMTVMKNLASQNKVPDNIALMLVTDEEIGGHNGTKYLFEEEHIRPDFFIAGEPTNLNICYKQKGVIWLEIIQHGKAAHGSRPWEGENANILLAQKIADFYKNFPSPSPGKWGTTYNLSILTGGEAGNIVPSKAKAQMDIRYIETDSEESILNRLRNFFPDTDITILIKEPYLITDKNTPSVLALKKLIENIHEKEPIFTKETFASDGRFYSAAGIPSINFGPIGNNMHAKDEWVDVKSLSTYFSILEEYVMNFNSNPSY